MAEDGWAGRRRTASHRRPTVFGLGRVLVAGKGVMKKGSPWPEWWGWELELSPHLLKRMEDRGFSEVDLRLMMEEAVGYRADREPGRWVMETMHQAKSWEVIVEPDSREKLLVVITAYAVETP